MMLSPATVRPDVGGLVYLVYLNTANNRDRTPNMPAQQRPLLQRSSSA